MGSSSFAEFREKTVIVTGAAGLVGSEVSARLSFEPQCRLVRIGRNAVPGVDEICDLRSSPSCEALVSRLQPDFVFHCAGTFSNHWKEDFDNNVNATHHMLASIRNHAPSARIVIFGSAAEYGDSYVGAVAEDVPPRPISIYGVTKSMQSQLVDFFHRVHGVNVVGARLFNLYGPGISQLLFPGRILKQIDEVRKGVTGSVSVRSLAGSRDYIPVEEAVDLIFTVMRSGSCGEFYNVGSGHPTTNLDLLHKLLRDAGIPLDKISTEEVGTSPGTCAWADLSRLNALLVQ